MFSFYLGFIRAGAIPRVACMGHITWNRPTANYACGANNIYIVMVGLLSTAVVYTFMHTALFVKSEIQVTTDHM